MPKLTSDSRNAVFDATSVAERANVAENVCSIRQDDLGLGLIRPKGAYTLIAEALCRLAFYSQETAEHIRGNKQRATDAGTEAVLLHAANGYIDLVEAPRQLLRQQQRPPVANKPL